MQIVNAPDHVAVALGRAFGLALAAQDKHGEPVASACLFELARATHEFAEAIEFPVATRQQRIELGLGRVARLGHTNSRILLGEDFLLGRKFGDYDRRLARRFFTVFIKEK